MTQVLTLEPLADIRVFLPEGYLVAFDVGPDHHVYAAAALNPLDYTTEQPGWATFPKTVPDQHQAYHIVELSGGHLVAETHVRAEPFNIHHVQPLGDDLLLLCCRAGYNGPDDFEKNGRLYARDGQFIRSVLLGDGIQSVQTTSSGLIWTSFFDEGVFGNFGWKDPIGSSGLVEWDSQGNILYEFQPGQGLDSIDDCYVLNVESDEDVWLYYYSQFPLVHLHRNAVQRYWALPIYGSDAIAVAGDRALSRGGYKERDSYYSFSLGADGEVKELSHFKLQDKRGKTLAAERVAGRGDAIYLLSDGLLYRLDLGMVAAIEG